MRNGRANREDPSRLDIGHPRGRLGEVDVAVAAEDLPVLLVQEPDLHLVLADLRTLPFEAEHQVQARVHGGKRLHPDLLEDPPDGELSRLSDERIVRDDGEGDKDDSSWGAGSWG